MEKEQIGCVSSVNNYTSRAIAYNAALLAGYADLAYNNNGYVYASVRDIASIVGTVSGSDFKWKSGGKTNEGVHMNQASTTDIVNSGIAVPSTFGIY